MGRNRKFVLEDDLQQAEVWKTISRGPRLPSAKWEKRSSPSAVSKFSQAPKKQDRQNPKPGKVSSSSPVSPDEALETLAAARARVAKFESALKTVRGRRNVPHFDGSIEESSVPGSGTTHPQQNCSYKIFLGEI